MPISCLVARLPVLPKSFESESFPKRSYPKPAPRLSGEISKYCSYSVKVVLPGVVFFSLLFIYSCNRHPIP